MRVFWAIAIAVGVAGITGIVYVATASGDQTLVGGIAGIAAAVPIAAAMGTWAGLR